MFSQSVERSEIETAGYSESVLRKEVSTNQSKARSSRRNSRHGGPKIIFFDDLSPPRVSEKQKLEIEEGRKSYRRGERQDRYHLLSEEQYKEPETTQLKLQPSIGVIHRGKTEDGLLASALGPSFKTLHPSRISLDDYKALNSQQVATKAAVAGFQQN